MKQNVVVDLDGTLADARHRLHFIQGTPKLWDEFHAGSVDDVPKQDIIDIVNALLPHYRIHIITGRNGIVRGETEEWLEWHEVPYHFLHMRRKNDRRHDVEVKKDIITNLNLTPENTLCVFEDRQRMVDAWREWGFTCLQVDAWEE